jgi:hypothetical protein
MPLPPEVVAAREIMNQAEADLRVYLDSGEHDHDKQRGLVENLRHAILEYEGTIAALHRP